MTFYAAISRWYDEIFPPDPATVRFLAGLLPVAGCRATRDDVSPAGCSGTGRPHRQEPSAVLDAACGTGGHALELARLGCAVAGLDLDGGMIGQARRKAGTARGGSSMAAGAAVFLAGDMRRVAELCPGPFDLAYCVGNSLVHLADEGEVGRFLESLRRVLRPGGRLAVQILNYDRILRQHVTELPEIHPAGGELRFVRRYEWGADAPRRVQFATELIVRKGGREVRLANRVPLLVLPSATLRALAEGAGFREIELAGDFQGGPHGPDSFLTVLTGRR